MALQIKIEEMSHQIVLKPDIANRIIILNKQVSSGDRQPPVKIVIARPANRIFELLPVIFYIHGGGLCTGTAETELPTLARWAAELGCVVVSPEYRMLPEYPYPAAVDDLQGVYQWIGKNSDELGIDASRIVAAGSSSGGHLAAALAYRLKDNGDQQFCAQILFFPVMDDRFAQPSSNINFANVWLPGTEQLMWQAWLGDLYGSDVNPDAVPGRTRDFSGLPPTILHTAELDHGRDDCLAYAQGLMRAGIFVDLHVWGGAYHTFDQLQPECELTERYNNLISAQLKDALTGLLVRK
jgi:acetyl esterase/lipase